MLAKDILQITENVIKEFGNLEEWQFNKKPANNGWSIGQCLHHLIVSNGQYIPILKKVASGKYTMTFWEKHNPLVRYTGEKMIKTLGPEIMKKYKSPLLFVPSEKHFSLHLIEDFKEQQNQLHELFIELEKEKYSLMRITSPVAGLITLSVHDAIKLIVAHERRHINQAIKVKNEG
jgi:uncharacterized damage-inducible protein DinB